MKYIFSLFVLGTLLSTACNATKQTAHAESTNKKTEHFIVYGKCGMCKKRIEEALNYTKGVQYAEWNVDNKILEVSFKTEKISLDQIKEKLAEIGHDTDTHRASKETYDNLHACCKYQRP